MAHKTLIYISVGITLLIAVVSLIPINQQINQQVSYLDKGVHVLMYFLLSFIWLITFRNTKNNVNYFYQILLLIALYGIIIEVLQEVLTTNRHGDLKDVIANVVGLIIAGIVYKQISKKN